MQGLQRILQTNRNRLESYVRRSIRYIAAVEVVSGLRVSQADIAYPTSILFLCFSSRFVVLPKEPNLAYL